MIDLPRTTQGITGVKVQDSRELRQRTLLEFMGRKILALRGAIQKIGLANAGSY